MISEVFNIDNMELMSKYPDKYFDLAVVDPPYKDDISGLKVGYNKAKDRADFSYEHFKQPQKKYFDELFRVSKNQIIWGFNYFLELLHSTDSVIIWNKHQNGHFSECELAWSSVKKTRIFDYAFGKDLYNKIHPTQKPIKLYQWIYHNYLPEGGKVLDTHLGSGSNRIAADMAGNIDFTACELDKEYFDAQEKRWREYKSQLKMF